MQRVALRDNGDGRIRMERCCERLHNAEVTPSVWLKPTPEYGYIVRGDCGCTRWLAHDWRKGHATFEAL